MKPIVLGYWANWNDDFGPEKLPWAHLTHVCYAFLELEPTGTPKPFPDEKKLREFVRLARKNNVKTLLSVGGEGSGKAFYASKPGFTEKLIAIAQKYSFDGLDIDWEFPETDAQKAKYSALLLALREKLPPKKLLTAAIPASDWSGRWIDPSVLTKTLSFMNVMSYDAAGPWSEVAGHHAPLSFCQSAITYWSARGIPKEKLVLGIPLYGRGFAARAFGENPTGPSKYTEVAWKDLKSLGTPNTTVEGAYLLTKTGEIIGFNNAHDIEIKSRWARTQKLAGIFFWELSQDPNSELISASKV
jgi:chitinase